MQRLAILPALVASAALSVAASAASVTLSAPSLTAPDSDVLVLEIDQTFTLDVVMDFTDEATLGGGFDIVFDTSVFEFLSFTNAEIGDADLGRDPDASPGLLESWAFADFLGLSGPALVGTVTFRYVGGAGEISTTATSGIGGPFVSADTNLAMDAQYNTLRTVPLPGAVWLMASGLAAFAGLSRRRA